MNKIKVACLFGGCSSEYDVSLVSATSVIRNLNQEKYELNWNYKEWGFLFI